MVVLLGLVAAVSPFHHTTRLFMFMGEREGGREKEGMGGGRQQLLFWIIPPSVPHCSPRRGRSGRQAEIPATSVDDGSPLTQGKLFIRVITYSRNVVVDVVVVEVVVVAVTSLSSLLPPTGNAISSLPPAYTDWLPVSNCPDIWEDPSKE